MPTSSRAIVCPRCGEHMPSADGNGSVCLKCIGERVFGGLGGFDSDNTDIGAADSHGETLDGDPEELTRGPNPDHGRTAERIGPYEIIEELGRGGMGRVYAARQDGLGRIVALKVIAEGGADATDRELRFLREAETMARLRHPHIVAVHASGQEGERFYFSMDLFDGGDLARRLRERVYTPRESAALLGKVAGALAYAHGEGVLHRDLKPSNILMEGEEPRLADFGLAVPLESRGELTATGRFLGTPHYLAPEVLRDGSKAFSVAADVYALGVMLFQMLTGRTPFAGVTSLVELAKVVSNTEPPSPRLLAPALPRDLSTICLRCLERDPAKRYATAAAVAEDLRRFLAGEPIIARPVSPPEHFARWCRRKPALAGVWFLVVALAIGSAAAAVLIRREQVRAETALTQTRTAEAGARERLRDARLAEARAVRRTTVPGRRKQALDALAEAAQIRPGADLRDEALAALLLWDVTPLDRWNLGLAGPGQITLDPTGAVAAVERMGDALGSKREAAVLKKWGTQDGLATLAVPGTYSVGPVKFSPDGKYVMESFADETVRVWRVGESTPCLTLPLRVRSSGGRRAELCNEHYAFTPDGRFLALGLPERGIALHRLADGGEAARWADGDVFNVILPSPDGRSLAAESVVDGQPRSVFVLTLPDLKPAQTFTPASALGLLTWSGDSRSLVVGQNDGSFNSYDVSDGHLVSNLTDALHHSVAVHPLGRDSLLAVTTASSMHLLNVVLGREELFFNGVARSELTADPAGRVFTMAYTDSTVARVRVDPPLGFQTVLPSRAAGYEVMGNTFAVNFSPDGRWVASVNRNFILVFDTFTGRLACDFDTGIHDFNDTGSVAWSADGRSLDVCSSASVFTRYPLVEQPGGGLTIGAGKPLSTEKGFFIADQSVDRKLFVLLNFSASSVRIARIADGKLQTVAQWAVPSVYNAAFSPDGEQVLVNTTGLGPEHAAQRIRIYRTRDGAVVRELAAHVSCDVAWSADGRTAMTSNGPSESCLWDTSDWHVKATLKDELGGDVTTYAIAPDSSYVVITHDDRIHLVSTKDGSRLGSFASAGATGLSASVRFQPDGKRFAVLWRDGRIDLVEPEALKRGLAGVGLAW